MKKLFLILLFATALYPQSNLLLFGDDGYTITNAETQAWYDKVKLAGGSVSDVTLEAVDNFFIMLADSSIRTKMLRVNLICGDNLTSVGIPQILSDHKDSTTMGYAVDSLKNLVAGDYTELTGLGNAANTTKYLKTGFNPSIVSELGLNDGGLGIYYLNDIAVSGINGCLNTSYFALIIHQATNTSSTRLNSTGGGTTASTSSLGYWDGNRTLSTHQDLYRNGSIFGNIARTSTAKPNSIVLFLAYGLNDIGTPNSFDTRKLGAYTIHLGLDATEERKLNNIIEYFQDKLGRGVQ